MQNMAFENVIILHYSFTTIFSCGTIFPSIILFFIYLSFNSIFLLYIKLNFNETNPQRA